MADDIVTQLEWLHSEFYDVDSVTSIVELAKAEIERLRTEVGRLRNSVDTLTNMLSEQCDMSDRYALAANKAEAENERLHVAIYWLVADIDHAHLPDPMGRLCITCGAGDGSWPCIHRRALNDLKEARRG